MEIYNVNILFCIDLNRFEVSHFVMLFVRKCVHFALFACESYVRTVV
jgi:hypothetical protein